MIIDILQFAQCNFVIVDSSMQIIHSDLPLSVCKGINEVHPYNKIKDKISHFFNTLSANQSEIIHFPGENPAYSFSVAKISYHNQEALLVISKIKNQFPEAISMIYEDLYDAKIDNDDAMHFGYVFDYIMDLVMKGTGMDCGRMYIIDPIDQCLKLTAVKGINSSLIDKESLYAPDSRHHQLIMEGNPAYNEYPSCEEIDDFIRSEGLQAEVMIPLRTHNTIIGAIYIGSHSIKTIPPTIYPLIEVISDLLGIMVNRYVLEHLLMQSQYDTDKIGSISNIMYQMDKDGLASYVSPSVHAMLGFYPSELIGRPFVDVIFPDDLGIVLARYERLQSGIFEPLEYRLNTKDGSYRYVMTISKTNIDKNGNFIGLSGVGFDIHAKKMAELQLKESEEKFKTLANSVAVGIFIIQDNKIQWINPAAEQILEHDDADIVGKPFLDFVHIEDAELTQSRAEARLRGEDVISRYEARILAKNNHVKWIDINAATIHYNGRLAILGSATDITNRKRIELELKSSEEKFYKAFHSSPIPMTIGTLKDGVFLEINEAAIRTFGFTTEEVIGMSVMSLKVFAHEDELESYINELRENKRVKDLNIAFKIKDGSILDCVINSDIFYSSGEKLVITSIIDVTGIKRSTQIIYDQYNELQAINKDLEEIKDELTLKNAQLFEEKERLNRILESINDAVLVTDKTGVIVLVNNAACSILKKDYDQLIGRDAFSQLILESRQSTGFNFDTIIKLMEDTPFTKECILHVHDKRYDAELYILPLKDQINCITGKVILIRDITQKKIMEDHIAQTSKLESVGLLAAGIAHDFNNILTSIVGNLSIIKNKIHSKSEIYEHIIEAENASYRAADLTFQLLTFAKGGAPVKNVASLGHILRDTAAFVLRGSGIECMIDIDSTLHNVEVDEGQISQVIQNIVINAREAMTNYGTLKIQAKNVELDDPILSTIGKDNFIKISIEDNGMGIAPELVEKLFDPYYTTKPHGSGLGLAVVYSIVKQHDGFIFVDSQLNSYTRFDIYLRAVNKQIEILEKRNDRIPVIGKGRVLVLEDDENIITILRIMLEELGYEIDTAGDADEAFEKFASSKDKNEPYSFIIMDLTIPGKKGGREAIGSIKALDTEIKVIVSSGYSNDPVMSNYRDYGFDGMLPKPYRFEDLRRIVADIILKV